MQDSGAHGMHGDSYPATATIRGLRDDGFFASQFVVSEHQA